MDTPRIESTGMVKLNFHVDADNWQFRQMDRQNKKLKILRHCELKSSDDTENKDIIDWNA